MAGFLASSDPLSAGHLFPGIRAAVAPSAPMALQQFRHPIPDQAEGGEQEQEQQGCSDAVAPAARFVDFHDQAQEPAQLSDRTRRWFDRFRAAVQKWALRGGGMALVSITII